MSYLTLSQKDINKLNEFKVGEKYTLQIEVELKSLRQGTDYEYETVGPNMPGQNKEIVSGDFDIESVVEVKQDGKKIPFKKMYTAAMQGKIVED